VERGGEGRRGGEEDEESGEKGGAYTLFGFKSKRQSWLPQPTIHGTTLAVPSISSLYIGATYRKDQTEVSKVTDRSQPLYG
jgi:hypothetical protein